MKKEERERGAGKRYGRKSVLRNDETQYLLEKKTQGCTENL